MPLLSLVEDLAAFAAAVLSATLRPIGYAVGAWTTWFDVRLRRRRTAEYKGLRVLSPDAAPASTRPGLRHRSELPTCPEPPYGPEPLTWSRAAQEAVEPSTERRQPAEGQIQMRGVHVPDVSRRCARCRATCSSPPRSKTAPTTSRPGDRYGQSIKQPYIAAPMTVLAEVNRRTRLLEVGSGSGYQMAILAELADRVYWIERRRESEDPAMSRWLSWAITTPPPFWATAGGALPEGGAVPLYRGDGGGAGATAAYRRAARRGRPPGGADCRNGGRRSGPGRGHPDEIRVVLGPESIPSYFVPDLVGESGYRDAADEEPSRAAFLPTIPPTRPTTPSRRSPPCGSA